MKLLLAILPLLASCEVSKYEALAKNGNVVRESSYVLGSTYSTRRADGSSRVYDGQDSFRAAASTAGLAIAGVINVKNTASNNNLSGLKATANTKGTVLTQKLPDGSTVQTITYPPQQ